MLFTKMPKYAMHKRTVLCLIEYLIWQRHQFCNHHLLVLDLCHLGISAFVAVLCHWYRYRIDRAPFLLLVYPSLQHGSSLFFCFLVAWLCSFLSGCACVALLYLLQLRASWMALARSLARALSLSCLSVSPFLSLLYVSWLLCPDSSAVRATCLSVELSRTRVL